MIFDLIELLLWWFTTMWGWLYYLLSPFTAVVGFISVITFAIVQLMQLGAGPQNLKTKYKAEWALVTGASSGIGKAITERFAQQGISVVMVAKDDDMFTKSFAEMQEKYRGVQFRKCAVDLGKAGAYMPKIVESTADLDVAIVCNNAGFILPGLFSDHDATAAAANFECNAACAMHITHHFSRAMILRKRKGLITFTSSAAAYFPGPTASLYASTKAFLTSFGTSIAAELRDVGIDVVVMHPSPIASNFYTGTANVLDSLATAQKAAASPFVIADAINRAAGRLVVWDQGTTSLVFRIVVKVVDFAFFNELTSRVAYLANPDHKKLAAKSKIRHPDRKD